MTDPISLIEARLHAAGKKVNRQGDKLQAQCPAHDDNNPSLSVALGTTRDVVMHCHAGCRPDDIIHALDVKWTDFGDSNPKQSPLTTWIYRDADGHPIYRVAKYPNKQFRQHAYDANTGEWLQKLGNTQRVPYRLPEIITAIDNGDTIWIAEGEKDVDALVEQGVTATCNSGGAGKFTAQIATHLRGAQHVVIVADRDEPGIEHANDIARKLEAIGITAIDIVVAAEGKDAADHIAFGRTLDEFQPLNAEAPQTLGDDELLQDDDSDLLGMLIDWPEFWTQDHGDAEWLIEPLIPAKRSIALFAPGGTGKSLLSLWMVASRAIGIDPFSGHRCEPIKVLYLDYEMTADDLAERLEHMGFGPGTPGLENLRYALLPSLPGLDQPEGGKAVVRLAELVDADLVVIDTFGRAVHGDENEADTVRAWYRWTGLHLKHAGRAFLRVDHAGKDITKGQRGTSAKNDDVDVVWKMVAQEGRTFKLTATKRRMGWIPETVKIALDEDADMRFTLVDGESYPPGTAEMAKVLDGLGIEPTMSARKAAQVCRDAGVKSRNEVLRAAQSYRFKRARNADFTRGEATTESAKSAPQKSGRGPSLDELGAPRGAHTVNDENTLVDDSGRAAGRGGAHPSTASGARRRSIRAARPAAPSDEVVENPSSESQVDSDDDGWGMFD